MKKWITLLMTLCASYGVASDCCIQLLAGYRQDTVNWDVQAPRCDPLIKVSSTYKDVDIFQLGARAKTNLSCNFYGRASFDIGWVLDGNHKDRTRLFFIPEGTDFCNNVDIDGSFSFSDETILDGRFVLDADIAIGYPFYFCNCQAFLAPTVGYSFNEQYFIDDENSSFAFDACGCEDGCFFGDSCCTSKFISKWYGPFIGLDFAYDTCTCFKFYGALEYHWVGQKTHREGRTSFSTFDDWDHHYNNARGWLFNIGVAYEWCNCWAVNLDFVYRDFVAHRHHHDCGNDFFDFFESSGEFNDSFDSIDDTFKTSVKWRSYAISLSLDRCF